MEYAKDVVLNLEDGQAILEKENTSKSKKTRLVKKIFCKISEHKVISTIVTATISFIVIDALLIFSFINILTNLC